MKHIAIYINSLKRGGTERVAANLAAFLSERGHRVTLVTQYVKENEYPCDGAVKRVISDLDADEVTASRVKNFCRRFMKLRRIWQSERPDLILSFIGTNNIMAFLTSRFLPLRVVVAVRAVPELEYADRRTRMAARFLFRFADGVLLQTEPSRAFFPAAVARKAAILPNPIAPAFFRPRFEGKREKTIVAAGRIDENKNHRLLIRAFAQIAAKHPDYRLIIHGEGDMSDTLRGEAATLGLAGRVELPGNSDRLEEALYRAAIYVLPSDSEGLPNTLIEAMLLGLACIATDCPCGGPAELIIDGENGLLTPVGDAALLAQKLDYLLDRPDEADRMGLAAHRLQTVFDPQRIGDAWESYLMGVINAL